jgi:adenine-specific DNA methylase
MAKTLHYYDVVRYSMTDYPEELINSEIAALEEQYTENAIDVYLGVDRTLYSGSFALTSAASRADAYTDSSSLADALFGKGALLSTSLQIASGAVGVGLAAWAIARSIKGADSVKHSASIAANFSEKTAEKATKNVEDFLKDNYSETLKNLRGSSKANNI